MSDDGEDSDCSSNARQKYELDYKIKFDVDSARRESKCKALNLTKLQNYTVSRDFTNNPSSVTQLNEDNSLNRTYLLNVIRLCREKNNWAALLSLLENVFSSKNSLSKSFLSDFNAESGDSDCDDDSLVEKADAENSEKEQLFCAQSNLYTADVNSIRKTFKVLFSLDDVDFFSSIRKGLNQLSQSLKRNNDFYNKNKPYETMNFLIILFEIPYISDIQRFETILPLVCEIVALLPLDARAELTEVLAKIFKEGNRLLLLHQALQQRITLRLLTTEYDSTYVLNQDREIINTVYTIECVYYASILAGSVDTVCQLEHEREYNNNYFMNILPFKSRYQERSKDMSDVLMIHAMDCRYPLIPYDDFVNETLNENINIENDYVCYKAGKDFSFVKYSFLLNTNTKRIHLFYDNRIRMRSDYSESPFLFNLINPSLKIIVDRDNLVDDTLNALEYNISRNPDNLKKRLYIEFRNEETVDEGGVSKEFFQLIIEKIFNPDYGMFVFNDETNLFWFNPFLVEDMSREFKLIGIILGLAIYNGVTLDLKLPPVLYRKLMGKLGNFDDLKITNPSLAGGLQSLLECDRELVTIVFDQNFEIGIKDSFGNVIIKELKEDGRNILLNEDNREEFVKLYADYLLNESIKEQFNAFYEGFQMVVDESPLKLLFRPDEIELVVCGSQNFDFHQLEKVTKYDGGYTSESETIVNFWEIIHSMTKEQHSKLLQFATGSDRVPIGGMKNMEFMIVRNGPDTNRLPTAHTCYNTLLLPDYVSKEKLRDFLLKAITYSKGFGIR